MRTVVALLPFVGANSKSYVGPCAELRSAILASEGTFMRLRT